MYKVDFAVPEPNPNTPPRTPFYKRKSFYWMLVLWIALVAWLFPTNFDDILGDGIVPIMIVFVLELVSLFIMVMCAYFTAISKTKMANCFLNVALCFITVLINSGGLWISMSCLILAWAGVVQVFLYAISGIVLFVLFVIKLVKGRINSRI